MSVPTMPIDEAERLWTAITETIREQGRAARERAEHAADERTMQDVDAARDALKKAS